MSSEQYPGRGTSAPARILATVPGIALLRRPLVRTMPFPEPGRPGFSARFAAPSTLLKQAPVAALFALAVVLAVTSPAVPVLAPDAFAAGILLMAAATVAALALTLRRVPSGGWWERIVPAIDFLAVEALRTGTGGSRSIFGVLVLVPAIWLAATAGRAAIALAGLGVAVTFLLPFAISPSLVLTDPSGLLRGLYTVLGYVIGAAVVNELARLSHGQVAVARARERSVIGELHRGGEVQQALLPKNGSPVAGYQVAGTCLPARAVGGDYYDWYSVPGGMGFTLGDVMGKGVGAGMIAAITRAVLRSAREDDDPVTAVQRANTFFSEPDGVDSFSTIFHARLRAADGRIRYTDAGHGLSVLVRADGSWQRLGSAHLPVGMDLGQRWDSSDVHLGAGETLVTFSDGLLDLYDDTDDALAAVAAMASVAASPAALVETLRERCANGDNPDDITVLALQRDRIPG